MLGTKLADRYEIVAELGRGGMGVVYRATDPVLNRDVAVKVIAPDMLTPESEERFQAEARVVAQMDHPAIVPIYDFGRHEGSLFFVMPVVQGESLRDSLRSKALTLGSMIEIGVGTAEALAYSHEHGVVHRDIKPENIMVAVDADGDVRLRIMDFGLARGSNVSGLTKTGMLMGTISYISPEQVKGGTIDGRTDLYALGCVLYECVVGEVPFAGDMQSVLYRVVHEVPEAPRSLGADIEPELEDLILACLAKEPADRPTSGAEIARRLRAYRSKVRDSQKMTSMMATQTLAIPRPAQSPFVGREEELKELQQRLNAALRGECQFVVVDGDAGAGKTRLLDELEHLAQARQLRVLHGRFVEQDGAFPYHGFCEAIQEFFRQRERGSASSAPPDLSDLADDLVALFPMLSEISAIRSAASRDSGPVDADAHRVPENRTEIFELLARTLTRLAAGKPLVLLLEDLHGADASIDALQYIVRRLGPTPTLIVGTYRHPEVDRTHPVSQMIDAFRGDRKFSQISLGPMTAEEHGTFLPTITGGTEIAGDLAEKLYEVTEGNPFFTKELVRSMIDAGSMAQDDTGSWSLAGASTISSESLPATIQQAVEARIDRLPSDLRELLAVASVMGRSFEFDDLEALAASDVDADDAVDRFIQEGLLEEDRQSRGDRLNFSSAVVREVLYGELGRRKRRRLHKKFAQRLERRQSGRLERVYPQLLYHFYEGDEADKTVEYGLLHAQRSQESFSPEEVVRAAKTTLEFLDEDWDGDPVLEGEVRMLLAWGLQHTSDMSSALREIGAAIQVFDRGDKKESAVEATLTAARTAWQSRQTDEARRWVDRGIEAARAADAREKLAEFLGLAATLANLRGDYALGREYVQEAESLASAAAPRSEREAIPRGGRLIVGMASAVTARAPIDMQLTEEFEVFTNVFETLLETDQTGSLQPCLAERWETLDGGRGFRFVLRAGVRFHDGSILDAESVKASFEGAVRGAAGTPPPGFLVIDGADALLAGEAETVSGLVAHSADTLEIRLSEELLIYPALLSDPRTAVVRTKDSSDHDHGTGPFRLADVTQDNVVLERNEDYWRGETAPLEAVQFRTGLSTADLASGFTDGELDLSRDLLPSDLDEILRDPRFHDRLVEAPQKFTYFALFNTTSGPLAENEELRRALAGTVRARDLVWQTLGRFAAPAVGLIPPGILGHDPGRRPHSVTIDGAREVIEAAGAGPIRLRAAVHPLISDRYGSLLEGMFGAWETIGVEVEVVTQTLEQYLAAWQDPSDLDLMIMRWQPDFDDPDSCTHILFHSRDGQLRHWFASDEVDELLESARRESRPGMREDLYQRFETTLFEGGVLVPLFHDIGYRLASSRLRGVRLGSVSPYVNYAELGRSDTGAPAPRLRAVGGGVIQVPISVPVAQLEPTAMVYVEEAEVMSPIYETLMRDVGGARIEPWLAADWSVEEGGARYRFRLRDDVRFHDGRRLTARDVRFSLERLLLAEDSSSRGFYSPVRGAQALIDGKARHLEGFKIHSALEFVIELETPVSFFPVLLSSPYAVILPEGTGTSGSTDEDGWVGTGPFKVASFEPGRRLELERNAAYWRSGYPRADRLIFSLGVEPAAALEGFRSGRFSLAADLFPDAAEALRRDPAYAAGYHEMPQLSSHMMAFNIHSGPLADARVRQRIKAALDVPQLLRQVLGRQALPSNGLIPPGLVGYDAERKSPPTRVAEEDLGIELTVALAPVYAGEYSPFRDAIAEALARIGVTLEYTDGSLDAYNDSLRDGNVDAALGRWVADYPDADTFVYTLHSPDGNVGRLCGTPEVDTLIAAGRAEVDPAARHAIYRQIERVIDSEVLMIPLFYEQAYRFARPELKGVSLSYWVPSVAYENLSVV